MNNIKNIYDYVEEQIKKYAKPIRLEDGWDWSMKDHLRRSYLYLNSQFEEKNEDRHLRPNKNIVLPVMNVQYRTVDFDVKDISLFIENPDEYYKSMLVSKYHPRWALEQSIDTFIDDMVVSYSDYGGILVRKTVEAKPEVIDLRTLAFCNQTDILAHPFAIRHVFSASQLRKENKKWGSPEYGATIDVETLIAMAKKEDKTEIEIFEVHGDMPREWMEDDEYYEEGEEKDVTQMQIISYFKDSNSHKTGVCLFRKQYKDVGDFFKFLARDKINGRALGRGGVEELFEPQIWTNWNEIKITEMLNSAAKTISWSTDPQFKARNNLGDVDNNEVLALTEGKTIQQLDTYPRNLNVFKDSVARWEQRAQRLGSATDPLLGETPSAGTPFKLYEAQQIEGKDMHKYRQGKLATFMDEIYRNWVLPHLGKEIIKPQVFMDTLSVDEMQEVVEKVMTKKVNRFKKGQILGLQEINEELIADYRAIVQQEVMKKGSKRFFEILKDEMKDTGISVMTNIAGKQKNLGLLTDKLVNVFRQYIASPQIRQDPEMAKLMNVILESSGLSPIMFGSSATVMPAQQGQGGNAGPMQDMAKAEMERSQVNA